MPLTGNIGGNAVAGSFTSLNGNSVDTNFNMSPSFPGRFRVMFVGPHATEIILIFVGNSGTEAFAASGVGLIDPYAQ